MLAILDYGAGNLTSVELALRHIGADVRVVRSADEALGAERIVFPGVGSAKSGLDGVKARGFDKLLKNTLSEGRPVLAICLGMQLIFSHSDEDNGVDALNIIPGKVRLFQFDDKSIKIPHMGWNSVEQAKNHPLWQGIADSEAFYFVHSYYVDCEEKTAIAGTTEYEGFRFTSVAATGSLFATQFHPERSGKAGIKLLKNFLDWRPEKC